MLGRQDSLKGLSQDASLHFVQWLTTRTKQRFASWQVWHHGMRTFIAGPRGPMLVQFVGSSPPYSWRLFTITSSSGIELLRATPPVNVHAVSLFTSAIDMLFLTISNTTE